MAMDPQALARQMVRKHQQVLMRYSSSSRVLAHLAGQQMEGAQRPLMSSQSMQSGARGHGMLRAKAAPGLTSRSILVCM